MAQELRQLKQAILQQEGTTGTRQLALRRYFNARLRGGNRRCKS